MLGNENSLMIAKKLGASIGGKLGEKSLEELELAFVTKLFPKKFSNMPTLRTRQHVLLYWRRGFLKTTILREFIKTIPEQFKVVRLSASTTEILLGSVYIPKNPFEKPRIIPSILAGADFAIITEHSAFLKHGGPIQGRLAILNDIWEGEKIVNNLVKLGQIQTDPNQMPELEKLGVKFEPKEAALSYEPDIVVFSASHPFDRKTLSLLLDCGHMDRFCIVQVQITPEIARECLQEEHVLDVSLQEKLRQQNEILSQTRIKSIETAPNNLIKPLYERFFALTEIPDFRIKGDVLRATAAHMVIRNFSQGNAKEVYTASDYSVEDADFVAERLGDFIEPRINPLVAEGYPEVETQHSKQYVKLHVCNFLEASKSNGNNGEPLRAIVEYVQSKVSVHYQTVRNAVQELVSQSRVEKNPERFGYYRLVGTKKED